MESNRETRVLQTRPQFERRSNGGVILRGHAAVFDAETDMGSFTESIAPGFFAKALKRSDVRMLWNHDPNFVLGRTKAGTLKLREDDRGLFVINELPDTQFARDLVTSMERGDIDKMSFAWITKRDEWTQTKSGKPKRRLLEAEQLYDVSVVAFPAYDATDVAVATRSLQKHLGISRMLVSKVHFELSQSEGEARDRELVLLKLRSGYVDFMPADEQANGQGVERELAIARLRQSLMHV
jgi:uncharacterized protein